LEERCQKCCETSKVALESLLTDTKNILEGLKKEIDADDDSYTEALK